jgi:hypothetical protein
MVLLPSTASNHQTFLLQPRFKLLTAGYFRFIIDFFSSLPLDLLVQIPAVSEAISSFKRYIKLIRYSCPCCRIQVVHACAGDSHSSPHRLLKLVRLRRLKIYYTRLKDTLRVRPRPSTRCVFATHQTLRFGNSSGRFTPFGGPFLKFCLSFLCVQRRRRRCCSPPSAF